MTTAHRVYANEHLLRAVLARCDAAARRVVPRVCRAWRAQAAWTHATSAYVAALRTGDAYVRSPHLVRNVHLANELWAMVGECIDRRDERVWRAAAAANCVHHVRALLASLTPLGVGKLSDDDDEDECGNAQLDAIAAEARLLSAAFAAAVAAGAVDAMRALWAANGAWTPPLGVGRKALYAMLRDAIVDWRDDVFAFLWAHFVDANAIGFDPLLDGNTNNDNSLVDVACAHGFVPALRSLVRWAEARRSAHPLPMHLVERGTRAGQAAVVAYVYDELGHVPSVRRVGDVVIASALTERCVPALDALLRRWARDDETAFVSLAVRTLGVACARGCLPVVRYLCTSWVARRAALAFDAPMVAHVCACAHGDADDVAVLLLRSERFTHGQHLDDALQRCAERGHATALGVLVDVHGADPSSGGTQRPLVTAAARGHRAIVQRLLADTRVDAAAANHEAQRRAAAAGHTDVANWLRAWTPTRLER